MDRGTQDVTGLHGVQGLGTRRVRRLDINDDSRVGELQDLILNERAFSESYRLWGLKSWRVWV